MAFRKLGTRRARGGVSPMTMRLTMDMMEDGRCGGVRLMMAGELYAGEPGGGTRWPGDLSTLLVAQRAASHNEAVASHTLLVAVRETDAGAVGVTIRGSRDRRRGHHGLGGRRRQVW